MVQPGPTTKELFRGPQLHRLEDALRQGLHVILKGPPGTGKSQCARLAIKRTGNGRQVITIHAHGGITESDLLDEHNPFSLYQAMKKGAILFIDEANRLSLPAWSLFLHSVATRSTTLPGRTEIWAKEGFQVVLAVNAGTDFNVNQIDPAIIDRFAVIYFDYLSPEDETDLLIASSGVSSTVAEAMVAVANETRKLRREGNLVANLTLRGLNTWAQVFQDSKRDDTIYWLQESAHSTWLNGVVKTDSYGCPDPGTITLLEQLIKDRYTKQTPSG